MKEKIVLVNAGMAVVMLLALAGTAGAQSIEIDPGKGTKFVGTTAEVTLSATGEPSVTCEKTDIAGETTSSTTATVNIDLTGCHITLLGITLKCHSVGAALDNTISMTNTIDFITYNNKPAGIYTPPFPTAVCGAGGTERKFEIGGKGYIGTVTSPACNVESKTATISIKSLEGKQEDTLYTGVSYSPTLKTEPEGTLLNFLVVGTVTITSEVATKMTCQ